MSRHALADYDWRAFAALLQERLREADNLAAVADEIGMSATDLNRALAAQIVSAPKLIAICDWMQVAVRVFYLRPGVRPALPSRQGDHRRPAPDLRRMLA